MNFYSENIINKIKKTSSNNVFIANFYEEVFTLSCKYSNNVVSPKYILSLLSDPTNSIAFRCIDTEFNIQNCPSILIYHKNYDNIKN